MGAIRRHPYLESSHCRQYFSSATQSLHTRVQSLQPRLRESLTPKLWRVQVSDIPIFQWSDEVMRVVKLTKQFRQICYDGYTSTELIHRGFLKLPSVEELRRNILLRLYSIHQFPIPESLAFKKVRFISKRDQNMEPEDLSYLDDNFPSISNFLPHIYVDNAPSIFEDCSEYEETCIPVIIKVPHDYQEDLDVFISLVQLTAGDVRRLIGNVRTNKETSVDIPSSANYSRKVWDLNGKELYSLTTKQMLKSTPYAAWNGIIAHHTYLTTIESFDFPVVDPHSHPEEVLSPCSNEMREINLFAKALTEYAKGIRIYIRSAMQYRKTDEVHAHPKYFWIRNGVMSQSITLILAQFLDAFFGVDAWICTPSGKFPPKQTINSEIPCDMRFNLLAPRVFARNYRNQDELYVSVVSWLFALQTNSALEEAYHNIQSVEKMLRTGELIPPESCYYDEHERFGKSWVHNCSSPKIDPHGVDEECDGYITPLSDGDQCKLEEPTNNRKRKRSIA